MSLKKVTITTDGGCSLFMRGKPGGWAAILRCGSSFKEISGKAMETTNNIMELTAILQGLRLLKERCEVTIRSDSRYAIDCCTIWCKKWEKNNWMLGKSNSKPVKNADLIKDILVELKKHVGRFEWVRGHSGDVDNERCDQLCTFMIHGGFEKNNALISQNVVTNLGELVDAALSSFPDSRNSANPPS